ncbi:hypothetical protein SHKM778_45080 [Streptomyces sp. KM77-8]|uniref:Uncharacterized protein n=1 Tax=Streptomyces haneummycinicus TaxID=3074435 RepID=A0AAT9HKZ6_9ACTN
MPSRPRIAAKITAAGGVDAIRKAWFMLSVWSPPTGTCPTATEKKSFTLVRSSRTSGMLSSGAVEHPGHHEAGYERRAHEGERAGGAMSGPPPHSVRDGDRCQAPHGTPEIVALRLAGATPRQIPGGAAP